MRARSFKTELRALLRLAIPLAAAQAGSQLMGVVDVAVLGRYGARELAGAGLANAVFFACSVIGIGTLVGIDPLISQAVGAGDRARARHVMWQGLWLSLTITGALTIVLVALTLGLARTGAQAELIEPAQTYLWFRIAALAPMLAINPVRSYLQAHGVTRPMVTSMVIANVVNVVGDIALVFGVGPIPPLGVAGAAIATVICIILQFTIIASAVRSVHVDGHVDHRWTTSEIARALRVGVPVGLQMGAEVGVFALVGVLAARLGTLDLAAHQLAINLASFTFTVALGVAAAGSVRVGIGVGARDVTATRIAGHTAFFGGAAFMGCSALAFLLFPRAITRLVTNQESVIAAALPLMLVAAVFQIGDGVQAVGAGVLRGAGDTRYAFGANVIGHWLIGLPIALFLGFRQKLGIVGLWWGLCVGLTTVAILLFVRFEKISRSGIAPLR